MKQICKHCHEVLRGQKGPMWKSTRMSREGYFYVCPDIPDGDHAPMSNLEYLEYKYEEEKQSI